MSSRIVAIIVGAAFIIAGCAGTVSNPEVTPASSPAPDTIYTAGTADNSQKKDAQPRSSIPTWAWITALVAAGIAATIIAVVLIVDDEDSEFGEFCDRPNVECR